MESLLAKNIMHILHHDWVVICLITCHNVGELVIEQDHIWLAEVNKGHVIMQKQDINVRTTNSVKKG